MAFQNRDLMPQGEDLGVLVTIAHKKKTQDREGVHHRQVGQSQQHSRSSCRDDSSPWPPSHYINATKPNRSGTQNITALTCTDGVSAHAGPASTSRASSMDPPDSSSHMCDYQVTKALSPPTASSVWIPLPRSMATLFVLGRPERAEEVPYLRGEKFRRLHGAEVSPSGHLRPPCHVEDTLDPRTGRQEVLRKCGHAQWRQDTLTWLEMIRLQPIFAVEPHRGADSSGEPVDRDVREECVQAERALHQAVAVAPATHLLDNPCRQARG